ncbi:ammonium transporter [Anthocerotibacter panamensis]|uniref:ammonium transporter n=1 Tax=Anthocerotibacter panamensis TaxID=2857077 RepID=UPI001FDA80C6|nr:ammonium transporter [Anthocerotibacter panamensis]
MHKTLKTGLLGLGLWVAAAPVFAQDAPKIDTGDTAWLLTSAALVLLMTPGLAFFYGGLVRGKNSLNTLMMSFVALGVIAIQWTVLGYSLAFAPGSLFLGGFSWLGLAGVEQAPNADYAGTVPHLAFMIFQMMFAIITPALISGAIVERMKFKTYVVFILLWATFVYDPVAHWVWSAWSVTGADGKSTLALGWLRGLGALDFAGGTVVHITAGVSALVAALIIGKRKGYPTTPMPPHNVPFVLLGAGLLWFGWFGFNAGSAVSAGGLASLAFVTTNIATAAALCTWLLLESFFAKPSAVGAATGAVVGLVAITPAAGFVTPLSALAIGGIGAIVSFTAVQLKKKFSFDDSLDVFSCHGLGGMTGAILTGVFCTKTVNSGGADGLLYGNPGQVVTQALAVGVTVLVAATGTAVLLLLLKFTLGLRPDEKAELEGLDLAEHGEESYVGLVGGYSLAPEAPAALTPSGKPIPAQQE